MITISQRLLIASLTSAVLTSSLPAGATVVRSVPIFGRPMRALNSNIARPFANSTARKTFVAGGATLPALAYEGKNALTANPSLPASGSIFAYFATLTGVTTQFCQTGSGFGRRVFDGDTVKVTGGVNGACPALGASAGATNGFGAPAALALTDPDITGTDIPLAQAEYTNFVNNKGATRGEAVSIPSVIGSVALLFNYPASTLTLRLTDSQICSLVEGKITNWSQLGGGSHPLTFVGRSDSSGTTFSFSNHLSAVCGSKSGLNTSSQFTPVAGTTAPYVQPAPPANFLIASGNPGVTAAIVGTSYSIGYVEAANALAAETTHVRYATVNGKDPIKDLPQTAAALTYSGTIVADNAVVTAGGAATVTPLTGVKKAGCIQIAKPSTYANITKGYPIIAITNFLFSSNGNGTTNALNLRALVTELNTPANFGTHITTVNKPSTASGTGTTGFSALGTSFNASLESVASNCIGT